MAFLRHLCCCCAFSQRNELEDKLGKYFIPLQDENGTIATKDIGRLLRELHVDAPTKTELKELIPMGEDGSDRINFKQCQTIFKRQLNQMNRKELANANRPKRMLRCEKIF